MINIFQQQKNDVGGRFFRNGKKLITKNDEQIMSCFKKTNDGNKEMIIFTMASNSKNFKMSFWVCTFR